VVERSASSVADARVNLGDLDVRVVRADVDRWRPSPVELVVADPSRQGLGRRGAASVARTAAAVVVLVSCDPAALGRDVRLLGEAGYRLERARLVDLFPQTHHLEVVTRFVPG
jgi:23S rRNA (uracil1939-C5)-methyltransferase